MDMKTRTADGLVVGGGLAGWMAARELAKAGMTVIMLQDGKGASPWVHGLNVPVHPSDSVDCFIKDTMESGLGISDPRLVRALCGDAPEIFQALEEMGLHFNKDQQGYQLLRPLGASHPRVMSIGNETGVAVLAALQSELEGRVEELPSTRAIRLITAEGRVQGALAYDLRKEEWVRLSAKAVILACGGFCGIYPRSTNKRDSGGDGVAMAYEAGAALCDLEFIQFEPSAAVWPEALVGTSVITTMFFEGAVLRNRQGQRFMAEDGPQAERVGKDVMARRIAAELARGNGTKHGGVYFDATGVGREKLEKDYPMYLERYRRVGIDLAETPVELAPAPHTSLGGIQTDENGRSSLPGLFACGESLGGLHGANRIGGSAGLETLVFGVRAGRAAAAYAQSVQASSPEALPEAAFCAAGSASIVQTLQEIRKSMQDILAGAVGPLRDGVALRKAQVLLPLMLEEVRRLEGMNEHEAFLSMRLANDLTTALLLCTAAEAREETRGCHARVDFPDTSPLPLRVVLKKGPDGARVAKETIS